MIPKSIDTAAIRRITAVFLTVALGVCAAPAQDTDSSASNDRQGDFARTAVQSLMNAARGLGDWKPHYEAGVGIAERVYQQNGWTTPEDEFSLELVRRVSEHEPWELNERWDTAMEMLKERYHLDEEQTKSLRRSMIRTASDVFQRNAPSILQYSLEAISTRAAGNAITPDQVARWSALAGPVMADARKAIATTAEEFSRDLSPEQQERIRADLNAAERRMDMVEQGRQRWARGEWEPREWGLDRDPIQLAGVEQMKLQGIDPYGGGQSQAAREEMEKLARSRADRMARMQRSGGTEQASPPLQAQPAPGQPTLHASQPQGETTPESVPPPPPVAASPARVEAAPAPKTLPNDAWGLYVQAFIKKFKLDDPQQQKAWSIYNDVTKSAERPRGRIAELATMKPKDGDSLKDEVVRLNSQLERIASELARRLERLPTRAQRRDAAPGELPSLTATPASRPSKRPGKP
ncbi:MAG: hypothetical protein U1D55_01370 [Phycisphaerae bacterium]